MVFSVRWEPPCRGYENTVGNDPLKPEDTDFPPCFLGSDVGFVNDSNLVREKYDAKQLSPEVAGELAPPPHWAKSFLSAISAALLMYVQNCSLKNFRGRKAVLHFRSELSSNETDPFRHDQRLPLSPSWFPSIRFTFWISLITFRDFTSFHHFSGVFSLDFQ